MKMVTNMRISRLICSVRRYHIVTIRTKGSVLMRDSHNHQHIGLQPLLSAYTSRLYSSKSGPGESSSSDIEMFRETPTFPPEWTDPSAQTQAPLDSSTTVADIVSQNPEIVAKTLGGYSPVGLLQTALDFAHTTLHMPWWLSIVGATVLIRLALFPLAVKLQVNAVKIANINPLAQQLHTQLMQAKASGDKKTEAELGISILKLYQENNCHPLKMFIMPLAQMPVFISFLMALRGMAQLPVESMLTGGIFWFQDLTVPDATYALPLIACATFLSNVELGGEGGAANTNETHKKMKLFLRASAFLILPVSITFPSALFCYWVTNSLLSTVQILVFKIPGVKTALGIPKINRPSS